jgi:hypothetical protein
MKRKRWKRWLPVFLTLTIIELVSACREVKHSFLVNFSEQGELRVELPGQETSSLERRLDQFTQISVSLEVSLTNRSGEHFTYTYLRTIQWNRWKEQYTFTDSWRDEERQFQSGRAFQTRVFLFEDLPLVDFVAERSVSYPVRLGIEVTTISMPPPFHLLQDFFRLGSEHYRGEEDVWFEN